MPLGFDPPDKKQNKQIENLLIIPDIADLLRDEEHHRALCRILGTMCF